MDLKMSQFLQVAEQKGYNLKTLIVLFSENKDFQDTSITLSNIKTPEELPDGGFLSDGQIQAMAQTRNKAEKKDNMPSPY